MARGTLRIHLGASPGVGKTFAMLAEGRRRAERGADVVIGVVETHGRRRTIEQLGDLETVPRREVEHRGVVLTDMDLDAVLARRPDVVLVDEYAHTNAPGGRHEKRWQDVEELLEAGIDVVSTLNVQHLESLNDVVARITGVTQRETVPDAVVRRADQIELVDMTPEALRRRMAHGNIYPAERIDAALANFFRPGNLTALRELALLWLADRVEESLTGYLADHGIADAWETRERVVVGLSGRAGGEALIRRAARMAGRVGGDLLALHVVGDEGIMRHRADALARQRELVAALGGRSYEVAGDDPAETLVAFARSERATQIVVGATRRSRWEELVRGSFVTRVTRLARDVDVHVIGGDDEPDGEADSPALASTSRRWWSRRSVTSLLTLVVTLPLLTLVVGLIEHRVELSTILLVYLVAVLVVAFLGGRVVAVLGAVAASLTVNWFFVEPRRTFTVADGENAVSLAVFVGVALSVGVLVDVASRREREASRARNEAAALARSAASLAADPDPLPALLDHIRRTFGLRAVRLDEVRGDGVHVLAGSGELALDEPTSTIELRGSGTVTRRLVIGGEVPEGDARRVLHLLADQVVVGIDKASFSDAASSARALEEIDAVRTALLRAVSHDLRTPIATIKALASGVLEPGVSWSDADVRTALASIDQETDRLDRVVGNLLDASRLQIGALAVRSVPSTVADVVDAALTTIPTGSADITVRVPDDLPAVTTDPALLERCIANLLGNAVRHGARTPVILDAAVVGRDLHLRVVDHGPGIPDDQRDRVIAPFQRLGDQYDIDGVGLGLAITHGFLEALGGELRLDETPGGGLTATVVLPLDEESGTASTEHHHERNDT